MTAQLHCADADLNFMAISYALVTQIKCQNFAGFIRNERINLVAFLMAPKCHQTTTDHPNLSRLHANGINLQHPALF